MENRIALFSAVVLGSAGVLCLCLYPLARSRDRRNASDIARAQEPLLLESMNAHQFGSTFNIQIPNDGQWRRIIKRLGEPEFVVTMVPPASQGASPAAVTTDLRRLVAVRRDGVDVAVAASSVYLESALLPGSVDGLEFAAAVGERMQIQLRGDPRRAEGERLVVMPKWTKSSVSAWGEGASVDMLVGDVGGLLVGLVGAFLIWAALIVAWGRPSEGS